MRVVWSLEVRRLDRLIKLESCKNQTSLDLFLKEKKFEEESK